MVVKHRVKCDSIKWRKTSGILCDWKISKRLKGEYGETNYEYLIWFEVLVG